MENKNLKLSKRFTVIIAFIFLICVAILYKAFKTIGPDGNKWREKVATLKVEDRIIPAIRGNIFASDGRLIASSIPKYIVSVDFKANGLKKDTLYKHIDELSRLMSKHFGEYTPSGWRSHILRGYNSGSRNYRLIKREISYVQKKELRTFPFFNTSPNKCGIKFQERGKREKPFGPLASRTIGDVYGDQSKGGKNGLELMYDSLLKGTPGIGTRQKLVGQFYVTPEVEPINGVDITTTIDINMQDIAHTALLDKLIEIDAESGTAVVMEVKTGEVKAISNLGRVAPGRYDETKNFAVADEAEPGSTFKVASMMVALDKGIIQPSDTIDTGPGLYIYAGARMTDHNMNHGGYHKITAAQTIWYSSNIGVAKIILKGFEHNPSEYVEALYDMSLNKELNLGIPGAGRPKIRHPKDSTRYWSKTTLPWMSFGYETQIPPIYTLTFYNAIANNGKMMKPYFVKNICENGDIIKEMKPEVVNSSICKRSTLKEIKQMLVDVVDKGTAQMIKSDRIQLAGKTGTAQISRGASGYRAGGKSHQVSFCGYFPAEDPIYSCIVVIRSPRIGYPSGGSMSGMVFKHIAERTYAQSHSAWPKICRDTTTTFTPHVKNGNYHDLIRVLDKLDLPCEDTHKDWSWTTAKVHNDQISLSEYTTNRRLIPSVIGMGAKDAVYILENLGLKTQIFGKGRVYSQSKNAGQTIIKNETIVLYLK